MELEKKIKFDAVIKDATVAPFNPLFSKAKVHVLYTGHNRNNSYFTKEAVEDALPSIFNIPVVGEYIVEKDNFGTHGGEIVFDEELEDYKFVHTTMPFGTVPESVNIYWENIIEEDGTENEYLVLDGVMVWTGRYDQLEVLLEQGKLGQSMEIEVIDGSFSFIDGIQTFKIDKFLFSGLCMLGVDKGMNINDHVEPCFESGSISVAYNLDTNKFTNEYNQMMKQLKYSIEKEGGTYVAETVVDEVKDGTKDKVVVKEVEKDSTKTIEKDDEVIVEHVVEKITETVTAKEVEHVEEVKEIEGEGYDDNDDDRENFEVIEEEVTVKVEENKVVTEVKEEYATVRSGDENLAYTISFLNDAVDRLETIIDEDKRKEDGAKTDAGIIKNLANTVDLLNDAVDRLKTVIDENEKERARREGHEEGREEARRDRREDDRRFEEITAEFESVKSELSELREYKRATLEAELSAKFEDQLSPSEMKEVFEKSKENSIDSIEKELFALVGKKNFTVNKEVMPKTIGIDYAKETKSSGAYGGLFEKYLENK